MSSQNLDEERQPSPPQSARVVLGREFFSKPLELAGFQDLSEEP
jgi:hypothetical protein